MPPSASQGARYSLRAPRRPRPGTRSPRRARGPPVPPPMAPADASSRPSNAPPPAKLYKQTSTPSSFRSTGSSRRAVGQRGASAQGGGRAARQRAGPAAELDDGSCGVSAPDDPERERHGAGPERVARPRIRRRRRQLLDKDRDAIAEIQALLRAVTPFGVTSHSHEATSSPPSTRGSARAATRACRYGPCAPRAVGVGQQERRAPSSLLRLAKDVEGASVVRPQRRRDEVHQYSVRRRAGVRDHLPIIGHARVAPVAAQVRREARRDGRRRRVVQ